jgi:hypothetical protein
VRHWRLSQKTWMLQPMCCHRCWCQVRGGCAEACSMLATHQLADLLHLLPLRVRDRRWLGEHTADTPGSYIQASCAQQAHLSKLACSSMSLTTICRFVVLHCVPSCRPAVQ